MAGQVHREEREGLGGEGGDPEQGGEGLSDIAHDSRWAPGLPFG